MRRGFRNLLAAGAIGVAGFTIHADTPASESGAIQLQAADLFYSQGLFQESLEAYRQALKSGDARLVRPARAGVIQSALRVAEFDIARAEAETLFRVEPTSPDAISLYADTLWSSGLFEEAETKYRDALAAEPGLARARHGLARSLAARSRLDEALDEAQAALRRSPRDMEIHHTVGTIYERMHRYEQAADAFTNYVNLLPNKDTSEKAAWSRAEIRFLRSFGERTPFQTEAGADDILYTIDFKLVNEKVVIKARINGSEENVVVDTGSENTTVSRRLAQRVGIEPITYTLSAGVGEVGLRGLQLARIDSLQIGTLKLKNVPCIIKNPPLRDIPVREAETLSPVALGYSMIIDYKRRQITFGRHLPEERADFELPLRMYRLATVRGLVDESHPTSFVVDTGGEVISISKAMASLLDVPETGRRIALKVYGTSGWDRDAFLLPGVDLSFDAIHYRNFPVVVLNLNAPSALLGFQLGGIVGHRFLSRYRVGIDLERSTLRLKNLS